MTDTFVYGHDKPAESGQTGCEVCGEALEQPYAFCTMHREKLRKQCESILSPRKVVKAKKEKKELWAHSPHKTSTAQENRRYRRYSLSADEFNRLLSLQRNQCAICKVSGNVKKLHIDHDHSCCSGSSQSCGACVRGLLCQGCNVKLAAIENADYMEAASIYLVDFPAREAFTGKVGTKCKSK